MAGLKGNVLDQIKSGHASVPSVLDFYDEYLIRQPTGDPLMPGAMNKKMPDFWKDIIWHIVNEQRWYLILIPREHYKTTFITTGIPIYRICKNEEYTCGVVHAVADQAQKPVERVQAILETDTKLMDDFGPFRPTSGRVLWRGDEFRIKRHNKTNTLPTMFSTSTGGKKITGKHCDQIFFDDIEDDKTTLTDGQRKKTVEWFTKTAIPVVNRIDCDGEAGQMIIIGTRKHPSDLYSRILNGDLKSGSVVQQGLASTSKQAEDMIEKLAGEINDMEIINV